MTEEEMKASPEYKVWNYLYTRELSRLNRELREPFVPNFPYFPEEEE